MENQSAKYSEIFNRPLEEIGEDPFFRADNFQDAVWYDDFLIFTKIGVCQPAPEYVMEIQKALKVMGHTTHIVEHKGKIHILPGPEKKPAHQTKSHKNRDMER